MSNLDALWLIVAIWLIVGNAIQHPAKANLAVLSLALATTSPMVAVYAQRHQWVLSAMAALSAFVLGAAIVRRGRFLEFRASAAERIHLQNATAATEGDRS